MTVEATRWTVDSGNTRTWNTRIRAGRFQIGYHLHRHRSPYSSDRWVFQPWITYDRCARRPQESA